MTSTWITLDTSDSMVRNFIDYHDQSSWEEAFFDRRGNGDSYYDSFGFHYSISVDNKPFRYGAIGYSLSTILIAEASSYAPIDLDKYHETNLSTFWFRDTNFIRKFSRGIKARMTTINGGLNANLMTFRGFESARIVLQTVAVSGWDNNLQNMINAPAPFLIEGLTYLEQKISQLKNKNG